MVIYWNGSRALAGLLIHATLFPWLELCSHIGPYYIPLIPEMFEFVILSGNVSFRIEISFQQIFTIIKAGRGISSSCVIRVLLCICYGTG